MPTKEAEIERLKAELERVLSAQRKCLYLDAELKFMSAHSYCASSILLLLQVQLDNRRLGSALNHSKAEQSAIKMDLLESYNEFQEVSRVSLSPQSLWAVLKSSRLTNLPHLFSQLHRAPRMLRVSLSMRWSSFSMQLCSTCRTFEYLCSPGLRPVTLSTSPPLLHIVPTHTLYHTFCNNNNFHPTRTKDFCFLRRKKSRPADQFGFFLLSSPFSSPLS